jgi:hypothetical protein
MFSAGIRSWSCNLRSFAVLALCSYIQYIYLVNVYVIVWVQILLLTRVNKRSKLCMQSRYLVLWNNCSGACSWSCTLLQVSPHEGTESTWVSIRCFLVNHNFFLKTPSQNMDYTSLLCIMDTWNVILIIRGLFFCNRFCSWLCRMLLLGLTMNVTKNSPK